jgi:sensor domain CHASE-containing protein
MLVLAGLLGIIIGMVLMTVLMIMRRDILTSLIFSHIKKEEQERIRQQALEAANIIADSITQDDINKSLNTITHNTTDGRQQTKTRKKKVKTRKRSSVSTMHTKKRVGRVSKRTKKRRKI